MKKYGNSLQPFKVKREPFTVDSHDSRIVPNYSRITIDQALQVLIGDNAAIRRRHLLIPNIYKDVEVSISFRGFQMPTKITIQQRFFGVFGLFGM